MKVKGEKTKSGVTSFPMLNSDGSFNAKDKKKSGQNDKCYLKKTLVVTCFRDWLNLH